MNHTSIAERVVRAAESQLGKSEAGGPNQGRDLQAFFDSDNYDPNGPKPGDDGYAWCAAFVCWCVYQAIKDYRVSFARPVTPGAWDYERWAKDQDRTVVLKKPHGGDIKRGDIVVFKHSHIGIAVTDVRNEFLQTVEGNTNLAGSREGDGVYLKRRGISNIRSRIRIHGKGDPS